MLYWSKFLDAPIERSSRGRRKTKPGSIMFSYSKEFKSSRAFNLGSSEEIRSVFLEVGCSAVTSEAPSGVRWCIFSRYPNASAKHPTIERRKAFCALSLLSKFVEFWTSRPGKDTIWQPPHTLTGALQLRRLVVGRPNDVVRLRHAK